MTDPKTLARTNDPQTSKDAAEKMVKSGALDKQSQMVFDEIVRYVRMLGEDFTTKDIAEQLKGSPLVYYKNYDICKKRFSGLRDKDKIENILIGINEKTGKGIYKRRDGCRVWRLK
jgi:hypothetical protein